MKKAYSSLIIAVALASVCSPSWAQQQDTGASGVIDGSDVYQFLNSGPIIDPTRMEEASRKFDSAIKMPDRVRQCKNWQEVIDRDRKLQDAGIGAQYPGDGTTTFGANGRQTYPQVNTTSGVTTTSATGSAQPQQKHVFLKKVGMDLLRAADFIGFPISDEPLPGDVDASLAGDLPAGPDPRVYVHETKYQPRPASAPQAVQVAPREEQPPVVMEGFPQAQ